MSGLSIDNSVQLPGGTFTSGIPSYDNIKDWSIINTSNLYNTSLIGNVGIGTSAFNGYKLNVNGSLNSTSLYQSGTLIDFSSYATNTNLTNNYYNKLSTDSLLNAKQNTLTAGTSLLGDGANITNLTYGNITGKPTYFPIDPAIYYNQTQVNNISNTIIQNNSNFTLGTSNILRTLINTNLSDSSNYALNISNILTIRDGTKQDTLTAATNLLGVGTSITAIDYTKVSVNKPTNFQADWNSTIINKPSTFPVDTTIYYNKTEVNTLIGNTSNYASNISNVIIANNSNFTLGTSNILRTLINTNLSDSSNYASNISNVIITNNSNFTLGTSNIITTNINTNYLKLAGGTLSGQLTLSTASGNNPIYISSTNSGGNNCINIKNNLTYNAYIGVGGSTMGANYANNFFIESAAGAIILNTNGRTSASTPNMIIDTAGNVGIGILNPSTKLYVSGDITSSTIINAINNLQENGTNLSSKYLQLSGGTMTGNITINNSVNPYIQFGATNGHNLGVATQNTAFSGSAAIGDMVLRSINNLILQSGTGGHAIKIDTTNNVSCGGNVGIGTSTNLNSRIVVYGTSQLQPKISLTGIEYYTGTNTNGDGIGLMLGVNRTNNRQLFICDTAKLTQNTTNSMIRMGVGGGDTFIDSMATDGATRLGLNLANAFYAQANNYGSMNKILKFHGVAVADDRAVMEGLIFNEGAIIGGVFAGDNFISGYWGVAVNLNSGGSANGIGGGNNGRSYIPGYSAFTINMRSSTTQTTFDKTIFIVYPDGQVVMKNLVSLNAGDNSYIKCGGNANGYYLNVGSSSSSSSTMYDAITGGIWMSFAGGLHLNACTNNNNAYINFYNTAGLLSVGGVVPAAKLHVNSGTASTGSIFQKYWSIIINDQTAQTQTLSDVCAIFESSVWCKSRYSVSSDERIKKNIQDINDDSALQKILLIQPKTYEYIDKVERGDKIVYGFIAQQIKEVIPEAITIEKTIIPNIFKICKYNNDIISLLPEEINKLKINDEIEIIIEDDNNKRLVKIIEINNIDNTIKINESLNITPETTEEISEETDNIKECFVYGSKVDDFHTLDKNYIYTLNVCATQELYKLIQQLRLTLAEQQERISILEARLN